MSLEGLLLEKWRVRPVAYPFDPFALWTLCLTRHETLAKASNVFCVLRSQRGIANSSRAFKTS